MFHTTMKLAEWAEKNGVSYKTAWRMFHRGQLPVPAQQLPGGMILVLLPVNASAAPPPRAVALYARVARPEAAGDLDRQIQRMLAFVGEQGVTPMRTVREVGSDRYGLRPGLLALLAEPGITDIVVERRERLPRWEFEYVEAVLMAARRRIVVIDTTESRDDLESDVLEMVAKVCSMIPGTKSVLKRAQRVLKAMEMIE